MRRFEYPERGSVVVFATAVLGLLLTIGAALGVVAALVADHRTAQAAADLAALAAAGARQHAQDACAAAAHIADANGARLTSCALAGDDVTVEVSVRGPHWLGQSGDLAATSRAGPR